MLFIYVIDLHEEAPMMRKRTVQIGGASQRTVQTGGSIPKDSLDRGSNPKGKIPFSIDVKGGESNQRHGWK
jgi:hypothetical protein